MKQYLRAELQHMAKEEILEMVPPDTLKRLKQTDKHPEIRVYGIGHEGEAEGTLIGKGKAIMKYLKDAVIKLYNRIKLALPIFNRHAETNLHAGRENIGEVVGKSLKIIGDKLYSLVAVYIYPQYRKLPLDVASIEAQIEFLEEKSGKYKIEDIQEVTGIALSSSAVDQPGFPGATLLGAIQAFADQNKKGDNMTLEEIKKAIEAGKYKPSEVFGEEQLISDPKVIEHVKKEKQGEYEHRRRTDDAFDRARDEWNKEKTGLEEKIKNLQQEVNKSKSSGIFEEVAKERELDDKQKAFIGKNLSKFEPGEDPEKVKDEMDKFIDGQLEEFEKVSEIFGEKKDKDKDKNKPGAESPSGDGKEAETEEDYENPEKNEFIPEETKEAK